MLQRLFLALQERLDKAFVVNVPGFFHILW